MEAPPIIVERKPEEIPYEYVVTPVPQPTAKIFWFSPTELKHLALSALMVMGVGLSIIPQMRLRPIELEMLVSLGAVFTSVFLLHELAHKLLAQHHGLWAEFRLTMVGALITILSIISPFKIISPGAVMISGYTSKENVGKTALAGPLTNIALSIIFLMFMLFLPGRFFTVIATLGAAFNAWIALINLIPIGMMDGLKVFHWSKGIWAISFILSIALTIFTFSDVFA